LKTFVFNDSSPYLRSFSNFHAKPGARRSQPTKEPYIVAYTTSDPVRTNSTKLRTEIEHLNYEREVNILTGLGSNVDGVAFFINVQ